MSDYKTHSPNEAKAEKLRADALDAAWQKDRARMRRMEDIIEAQTARLEAFEGHGPWCRTGWTFEAQSASDARREGKHHERGTK